MLAPRIQNTLLYPDSPCANMGLFRLPWWFCATVFKWCCNPKPAVLAKTAVTRKVKAEVQQSREEIKLIQKDAHKKEISFWLEMQKSAHIPSPCSQSNTFGKVTSLLSVLFVLTLAVSIYLYWCYTRSYNLHTTVKHENKALVILQDNSAYAMTMCWKLNCVHPSFLFLPEVIPILNLALMNVEAFSNLNGSLIPWSLKK